MIKVNKAIGGIKLNLKLDHMLHYINQLQTFKYPGELLRIYDGGKHEKLGTFNRLVYLDNAYIELLDVYNAEILRKITKSEEGRVSFPSKIIQDNFAQGLKTVAFQTDDLDLVKQQLIAKDVDVVGPVNMHRVDEKGNKIHWRLLYIADPDYRVKPPFFIQWEEPLAVRNKKLAPFQQQEFTVTQIRIDSTERAVTVQKWQTWFDMEIIDDTETYTSLKLPNDTIVYEIYDGEVSKYHTVILKDEKATSSYSLIIRGVRYRFDAD